MARRLNWGAGPEPAAGWANSDVVDYGQEHVGDLLDGLPWPDGWFDYAVANHSLQALAYHQLRPGIAELARVLRPGGTLRVLVPDPELALEAYRRGDASHFPVAEEASLDGKLCMYLTWAGTNRTVFTARWLCELLVRWGFTDAAEVRWGETASGYTDAVNLDSRRAESLVVEAVR